MTPEHHEQLCEECNTAPAKRNLNGLVLCQACFNTTLASVAASQNGTAARVDQVVWIPLDLNKLNFVAKAMESGEWTGKYLMHLIKPDDAMQEQALLNWAEVMLTTIKLGISERMSRRGSYVVCRPATVVEPEKPAMSLSQLGDLLK